MAAGAREPVGNEALMIAIDGARILTDGGFRTGTTLTKDGTIAAVAWFSDDRRTLCESAAEIVDGTGMWLVPGLVSAHTHAYGTLLRGTESALPLELWALYTMAYGAGLDEAAVAAAMLLHDAECIRSGITGIVDHFPRIAYARAAFAAHESSGLRVLFAAFLQDISDYDLLKIDVPVALRELAAAKPVDERAYEAFFADLLATSNAGSGRVRLALGPNAPQRCSPDIWSLWQRLSERYGVRVHCHALETRAQARIAQQRWPRGGMLAAMDDAGLLDERLSLAHAIYTTDAERELLAKRGVAISHNPLSNLTLGSGILPLRAYLDAGVPVGIGTDASNSGGRHDMFEMMRLALTLPRVSESNSARWPSARCVLDMATTEGSRIIGSGHSPAGITVGAPADVVLVRCDEIHGTMLADTIDGFVFHAGREAVEAVMIEGRWVLRDGRILTFDEARVVREVADAHARIAERTAAVRSAIDLALADVAAQFEPWLAPLVPLVTG